MQDEEFLQGFGAHVKRLRELKRVSDAEMARHCYMDRGKYIRIETVKTNPTLVTLANVCIALDISFQELLHGFHFNPE